MMNSYRTKYRELTNDEFIAAIEREDYDLVITCTLPMIRNIADSFTKTTDPVPLRYSFDQLFEDYMTVGMEAVWNAAKRYDRTQRASFVTYARTAIKTAMSTRYNQLTTGDITYNKKTKPELSYGYVFDDGNYDDTLKGVNTVTPISDDEVNIFENVDKALLIKLINKAVTSKFQRRALKLYYGLETGEAMSLRDVGIRLGITSENVRQLNLKAMRHLQENKNLFIKLLD